MLDGLMFDNYLFYPFAVMVGFLRAKASVFPRIFDDAVMHEVVKGCVFEFIGRGHTKNWVVCYELHQYCF